MSSILKSLLVQTAQWAGDRVAGSTGWVAVRVPLECAHGKDALTLPLPGYMQTNSYGCGGVTAAMAARYLRPELGFGAIYDAVNPSRQNGAGRIRVARSLRACGLRVSVRKDLTFLGLIRCIKQGSPVLVSIHNPGSASRHWVVVYGYGRHPDQVYIATNGLPWLTRNRVDRGDFEKLWAPKGNGLVCSKSSRRLRCRQARSHSK